MLEIEGSYIQYAAGFDKDNITKSDVDKALNELPKMDDEHGAFWISVYGADSDEFVLELHKSLTLFANFGEEDYKITLNKVDDAKEYYYLLLEGQIDELRQKIKN